MRKKHLVLLVVLIVILSGCNVDIFNSGCRKIGNSGYSLCRWEDRKTFYLEPNHQAPSGGGVLQGTVQSIWWSDKVIVARRHATFRGDPDGLMVVDIATENINGPVDQKTVAKRYPLIKLMDSSTAWKSLR